MSTAIGVVAGIVIGGFVVYVLFLRALFNMFNR